MLRSWDGCIRLFAAWPKDMAGSFTTLRAEGAFLVSASCRDGNVADVSIHSEKGARCRVANPWAADVSVVDGDGKAVETTVEGDIVCFDTAVGGSYRLAPAS